MAFGLQPHFAPGVCVAPDKDVRAGSGHKPDVADLPRGDVEVDAVLGQQLIVASLECRYREHALNRRVDDAQARPLAALDGDPGLVGAIHEAHVLSIRRELQQRLLVVGKGVPVKLFNIQHADDEWHLPRVRHQRRQGARQIVDDEHAVRAAARLVGDGVVVVGMVPMGATHVVLANGVAVGVALPRFDGGEDAVPGRLA
mmetsp:Transcript_60939/g.178149  ORF Transcript_60939/g.178149 Transcript_60939/m.178149 type:complete len:200 (-) Transcript_60939:635-1234(-)